MEIADLVRRIDQVPSSRWSGSAWRHVAAGRPPLSSEGARITGGRWNPPGSFAALYLGTSKESVIAEFHRLAARQRLDPTDFLPRTLYRYGIELTDVLDLTDPVNQDAIGYGLEDISGDDLTTPRNIGEAAFACGREAVSAPSATGHGQILVVYLERLSPGSYVREEESEMWEQVPDL